MSKVFKEVKSMFWSLDSWFNRIIIKLFKIGIFITIFIAIMSLPKIIG